MDRNRLPKKNRPSVVRSLSARRAWIEIVISAMTSQISVSLSARRAWIEILCAEILGLWACVALRKESVDRNSKIAKKVLISTCRSPQGERG